MTDIQNIDINQDGYADADLNHDGIVTQEEIDLYRKHIVKYFDDQMSQDIMNLDPSDKIRFYQMVEQYGDIFTKIFHKGIPIVEHIVHGDEFYSAKLDPHEGIDWTPSTMVKDYIEWKEKQ
jgi:hypothetical protein